MGDTKYQVRVYHVLEDGTLILPDNAKIIGVFVEKSGYIKIVCLVTS